MTTKLWLARHGQTDWNVTGRYQGQADPPLNPVGLAQAEQLRLRLATEPIAMIYSSDLQRAVQTAEALASGLNLPVRIDPRLREVSLGAWEGMLSEDIRQQYPTEWQQRRDNPLGARPPGGESLLDLIERTYPAVDEIARRHPHQQIVIVSHGLTLACLISRARGLPLAQAYQLIPDNAQPVLVEWGDHLHSEIHAIKDQ